MDKKLKIAHIREGGFIFPEARIIAKNAVVALADAHWSHMIL